MLRKVLFCMSFVILATGYSQIGKILSSQPRLVPKMLNYQAFLTDTMGIPVNDTLDMTFRIFDADVGGNEWWSENQLAVSVVDGNFFVLLGGVTEIPDSVFTRGIDRWLELGIEGDTLSPRMRIAATAYAYTATYSDTAEYAKNVAADNDWVRGTPDSVLFTANYLGVARGGAGNMLYGDSVHTHTNLGVACTTGAAGSDNKSCTVAGGYNNIASGYGGTVGGGETNDASGTCAIVGGGFYNTASGITATIAGGQFNTASGWSATVPGGWHNAANGYLTTVGGGTYNTASDDYATVGGGRENTADSAYATMGGGRNNTASDDYATVGGGRADTVNAVYGGVAAGYSNLAGDESADTAVFVGGGYNNSATGKYAAISGGKDNIAIGPYATVGGGYQNKADTTLATVGGGYHNIASEAGAVVGGGYNNNAREAWGTVGGGRYNEANYYATVSGGSYNWAKMSAATVGGGWSNIAETTYATVGGGIGNYASNYCATVAGGYFCESNGEYSFTVGNASVVPSSHSNSVAFNGQTATASGQTRIGVLSKASGSFTIDHPTEPMNKILNHYFVESPEMVLIYRGVAIIGSDGRAEIHLPDYFDALNKNPMVQLTGVGTSDVYVAEKVTGNHFVIGGKPRTEVYWTVTAERKDQSAEITRIIMPVEQLKEGDLIGHSLDDDFLATTMSQLERMGQAGTFRFRTAEGQEKYERSLRALEETGPTERR